MFIQGRFEVKGKINLFPLTFGVDGGPAEGENHRAAEAEGSENHLSERFPLFFALNQHFHLDVAQVQTRHPAGLRTGCFQGNQGRVDGNDAVSHRLGQPVAVPG